MMKEKAKKAKRTPEQQAKTMESLVKKFSESESGRSMVKFMNITRR